MKCANRRDGMKTGARDWGMTFWMKYVKDGQCLPNVGEEVQRITDIDQFLALCIGETARNFRGKS
jgi:hypothetical protein